PNGDRAANRVCGTGSFDLSPWNATLAYRRHRMRFGSGGRPVLRVCHAARTALRLALAGPESLGLDGPLESVRAYRANGTGLGIHVVFLHGSARPRFFRCDLGLVGASHRALMALHTFVWRYFSTCFLPFRAALCGRKRICWS